MPEPVLDPSLIPGLEEERFKDDSNKYPTDDYSGASAGSAGA